MSVWQEVVSTVQQEFSDIPDVSDLTRIVLRLTMAIVLGGILGYERETRGMAAGLRTHMLVALGAAMFVMVPAQAGMDVADMSRVLQGVIAGIGFLGAGAIIKLRNEHEIRGLTTAASIWLTAAIGIAAGMGREATAVLSTLMALVILSMLRRFSLHRDMMLERAKDQAAADKAE
ncbi:MgtC/SapB family protein [Pigmentiphaga aceris]|uniref:Protein MgtC n=1 Tax=Pigmentiphaga aceris TaxID=1940612 RepID=A0A5C0AZT0_9BURK|nr:MgtC/SapB family protein [Pigmentiphaga aceris]QEI06091.1 MgtC/SapB family protein [Pigmentiphaga aceris]